MPANNGITASTIIKDRMPELHISRQHTTSFGIHSIDILAPIHLWNDFERTVRTQTDVIQLKRTHLANIPQDTATRANHIANEQLLCGDEASVQARFNQNVCHPISSIYALQEIQCRFGDAHTTNVGQNLGGIPDIICVTDNGGVRLVGEVKTPWIHKFKKVMRDPTLQRRWFGQIASYMRSSGCKYGFMTTYKETIFFKEDIDIANPNGHLSMMQHYETKFQSESVPYISAGKLKTMAGNRPTMFQKPTGFNLIDLTTVVLQWRRDNKSTMSIFK